MKRYFVFTALSVLIMLSWAHAQEDHSRLIFPDPTQKICLVKADGKAGTFLSGEKMPSDSPLAKKIMAELDLPFHQSVIKLSQCSRNLVKNALGPNVLFLSQNEGGFPRRGLTLREGEKSTDYPYLSYIDLVIDEKRLAGGELDIFSHELGHVMMMNIWHKLPERRSNKMHVSMGITDYSTAIFEGWGIHFQRLVYDSTELYRKKHLDSFDYTRSINHTWHSNLDQDLRLSAVLGNDYIHQKLLPGVDTSSMDLEELIMLEHASPIFDKTRLKNAQQMLSCEGVLATLFYRINTNRIMQQNYKTKEFYEKFLLAPIPEGLKPHDIFTPFENIILKHFWVWSQLEKSLKPDKTLFLEYLKAWSQAFPEDVPQLMTIFILTTAGRTVSPELGALYEKMSFSGMSGNIQEFRKVLGEFRQSAMTMIKAVMAGKQNLDAAVGPQIWVQNKDFQIRYSLWDTSRKRHLWINLNTASVYDLMSFPGITENDAQRIISKREELGFFKSLDDAKAHGFRY